MLVLGMGDGRSEHQHLYPKDTYSAVLAIKCRREISQRSYGLGSLGCA
jgi:hypothetical protein